MRIPDSKDEADANIQPQGQVMRAAALVMMAFALSRVLGLVRQMVFGLYFGAASEMDAYVAALRIPEAIFLVVAGGALGSAFIPLFTYRLAHAQVMPAWRLASSIINLLLVLLIPLTLLCIVFAPWLVQTIVAPAMTPSMQAQTVNLMRVMLLSTAIFGVSGIVMGTLNAHQHFLLPAIAPILYNLALIGGAVIGAMTSLGTMGPAIGMVVGAVLHLCIQVPGLVRYQARYMPVLGVDDPGVLQVGRLMLPRVLGVAAVQINFVVSNNLASRLGPGAISALDYAWRVMLLPQGIFAQAVGTAAFPTFSAQSARGAIEELRKTLLATVKTMITVTIPASMGLIFLGGPIITVLFQQGAFDVAATRSVAWALRFFAIGLVGHSVIEVLARAFYALHDTWTPALAAVGSVLLNVLLGLLLPPGFVALGLPSHSGLACANALSALSETVVLLILIQSRIGRLNWRQFISLVGRVVLASTGMALGLWVWLLLAPGRAWIQVLGGIPLGISIYVGLSFLLRVDELWEVVKLIVRQRR
ncbi:MAG: murein biosynthesis integral membrane protein MurJ [Anaerolineae bacterium]|nr:murein biosynthesis integral membrane protein MurJ [Anaerolineae bacterium]